jgi:hypothetical protein
MEMKREGAVLSSAPEQASDSSQKFLDFISALGVTCEVISLTDLQLKQSVIE